MLKLEKNEIAKNDKNPFSAALLLQTVNTYSPKLHKYP